MRQINRNVKRLDKIEIKEVKLEDGSSIRILRDKETNQLQLIVDHKLLSAQNQGVKSDKLIEQEVQPYVLVEGFYQD